MFFKKKKKEKTPQELINQIQELEKKVEFFSLELEKIKQENWVQKIGVTRYNPFSDIGGDQSFSIAVLDKNNDGFVITSLYAREGNRVYAKPIKNSISEYTLSQEEEKAIKLCQKK